MAIFGKSEDFEFERLGAAGVTTSGTYYDTSISRCALAGTNSETAGWVAHNLGDFEDFWCSIRYVAQGTTMLNGRTPLILSDAVGTPRFRLLVVSSQFQPQHWDGSSWVNIGPVVYTYVSGEPRTIVVRINKAANNFTVWSENFVASSQTVNMSGWQGIRRADLLSWCNNNQHAFSEFIWGNEPVLLHRYVTRWPTANGDLTDGLGSFVDVNEVFLNDTNAIVLETAGQSKTFLKGSATLPTGDVRTVKVSSKVGNVPAVGAQNVKARLRKSGVNYDQPANFGGFATGNPIYEAYWVQDPSTSASWTREDASSTALQFGLLAQP